jgi:hypothetical protein
MRLLRNCVWTATVGALLWLPAYADGAKQVQNSRGSVSYQAPNKASKYIAPQATMALADRDTTFTGDDSLATVSLPDSSQVLVGSNSKVQLAFFNQTDIANASFVIYQGKFRFTVNHPSGARANYTFQTPTAQIAVRGTNGDISVGDDGTMSVNVYALSSPDLPVQITTKDGKTFVVNAGQTFAERIIGGIIQGQVSQLSDAVVDQFTDDFGIPPNWDEAKGQLINAVESKIPCVPIPFVHPC